MTDWRWPHFKDVADGGTDVLRCSCGCGLMLAPEFMDRLEELRAAYDRPIKVISGARCPAHNDRVSNTGRAGPHTTGHAADIGIWGSDAVSLLREAMKLGFTGFGIDQKGPERFIHLDDLTAPEFPRPVIWSYP